MKTKEIQIKLIEYLDLYEKEHSKDCSIRDFATYLYDKEVISKSDNPHKLNINVELSKNASYIHRYIKLYLKKIMKDSLMRTEDEYTYLITLLGRQSLTKTELNNLNIFEKTTGTEIIKRLLKSHLVQELDNPTDKRTKLVAITEEGKSELKRIMPALHNVSELITTPLTESEKEELNIIQKKLIKFHNEIFLNNRQDSIKEIIEKIKKGD